VRSDSTNQEHLFLDLDTIQQHLNQLQQQHNDRDLTRAAELTVQVLARYPYDYNGHFYACVLCYMANELEKAVEVLQELEQVQGGELDDISRGRLDNKV
jgi:hypothetical protein